MMDPLDLAVATTLVLTLLSAAAAIWLASVGEDAQASRKQVAERLAQIAVLAACIAKRAIRIIQVFVRSVPVRGRIVVCAQVAPRPIFFRSFPTRRLVGSSGNSFRRCCVGH